MVSNIVLMFEKVICEIIMKIGQFKRHLFKVLHVKLFYILGDGGATKGSSADDAASDSGTAKSAK